MLDRDKVLAAFDALGPLFEAYDKAARAYEKERGEAEEVINAARRRLNPRAVAVQRAGNMLSDATYCLRQLVGAAGEFPASKAARSRLLFELLVGGEYDRIAIPQELGYEELDEVSELGVGSEDLRNEKLLLNEILDGMLAVPSASSPLSPCQDLLFALVETALREDSALRAKVAELCTRLED